MTVEGQEKAMERGRFSSVQLPAPQLLSRHGNDGQEAIKTLYRRDVCTDQREGGKKSKLADTVVEGGRNLATY